VPLLLLFFAVWNQSSKALVIDLLVLSWLMDAFLLFEYITKSEEEKYYESGEKG
jgi:hypothetical protein